jgi:hypothetical protein
LVERYAMKSVKPSADADLDNEGEGTLVDDDVYVQRSTASQDMSDKGNYTPDKYSSVSGNTI